MPEAKAGGEAIEAAAAAVEEHAKPVNNTLRLTNGIVLKLKSVPPFLIRQAARNLVPPEIPMADVGKGRVEPNPDDPIYLQKLEEYGQLTTDVGLNVTIAAGTEIQSLPDSIPSPEDDSWLELLGILGVEVDVSRPVARYLAWARYVAITDIKDIALLMGAVSGGIGMTEEEVEATVHSFRNRAARRANKRSPHKAS